MADQLCTPADLASRLQQDLDASTATLLVECATAVVQASTGQRIVDLTDTAVIDVDPCADWDPYLPLPQLPVRSVATVLVDDVAVTDYRLSNQKLWRACGWRGTRSQPTQVKVTYAHGYQAGSQYLQLARNAVLSLAAGVYVNPDGTASVKIDDYAATYEAMAARMDASPYLREALQNAYGQTAYVTSSR